MAMQESEACACACNEAHGWGEFHVTPCETLWFKRGHKQTWLNGQGTKHGVDVRHKPSTSTVHPNYGRA